MLRARRIHHEIVPRATALVLNDVTKAFVDPGGALEIPAGRNILGGLADLARACRAAGSKVIYVGYVQTAANRAQMGKFWPSLLEGALDRGSVGSEITEVLKPTAEDWVIEKKTYSAFLETDLESRLKSSGIDTLIIGGVSTNHACYTAARDAQCRGFRVIFLSDGTATFDLDDVGFGLFEADLLQRAFLTTVAFGCGEVAEIRDVINRL